MYDAMAPKVPYCRQNLTWSKVLDVKVLLEMRYCMHNRVVLGDIVVSNTLDHVNLKRQYRTLEVTDARKGSPNL